MYSLSGADLPIAVAAPKAIKSSAQNPAAFIKPGLVFNCIPPDDDTQDSLGSEPADRMVINLPAGEFAADKPYPAAMPSTCILPLT